MKSNITITKPDKSRSCHHCRHADAPIQKNGQFQSWCKKYGGLLTGEEAQACSAFRDTRRTSQVISASGKVFD